MPANTLTISGVRASTGIVLKPTVFQRQRLPPEVPTRVKYLSFNELSADAHKLSQPWVLLRSTDENTIVAKVNHLGDVGLKVVMDMEFNAAVYWQGILNAIDNSPDPS